MAVCCWLLSGIKRAALSVWDLTSHHFLLYFVPFVESFWLRKFSVLLCFGVFWVLPERERGMVPSLPPSPPEVPCMEWETTEHTDWITFYQSGKLPYSRWDTYGRVSATLNE